MKTEDGVTFRASMGGDKAKNPMRDLKIRKLCLNICVGESGDRLTRAGKVKTLISSYPRDHLVIVKTRCLLQPEQSVVSRV